MSDSSRHGRPVLQDFASEAAGANRGIVREFLGFMKQKKKWWILPILVAFGGLWVLVFLGGTAVAPFIYTLF